MESPRRSKRLRETSPPPKKLSLCTTEARKRVANLPSRIEEAWKSLAWDVPYQESEPGPIRDAAEMRRQISEELDNARGYGVPFSCLAEQYSEEAILTGLTVRGDWHVCPRRGEAPPTIKLGDAEHCRTCAVLRAMMNNNGMLAFLM